MQIEGLGLTQLSTKTRVRVFFVFVVWSIFCLYFSGVLFFAAWAGATPLPKQQKK